MKCFSSLTDEERTILRLCIQKCLLEVDQPEYLEDPLYAFLKSFRKYRDYHPLALSALGGFFYRFGSNCEMLDWKDSLEEEDELVRNVLQSKSIRSIIDLQFSTFSSSEQLLFLDNAVFEVEFFDFRKKYPGFEVDFDFWVEWLSTLHGKTASVIKRRLRDLKRSGMINWGDENDSLFKFEVHSLYKEFAMWFVTEHEVTGFKNAWGVFQPCGTSFGSRHQRSKCISDLVRLRVFHTRCSKMWTLLRNRMIELQNLCLLQLCCCQDLRELSLEGLDSLRHLELSWLLDLKKLTMTRSSGSRKDGGIFESLQYVSLRALFFLRHVPDFTSCTSLRYLGISHCRRVTNFEKVGCPHLRRLELQWLRQHQLGSLPNFGSLDCLKELHIELEVNVDIFYAMDVHVNPNNLKQGRNVESAIHQGPEDSDEFSADSDAEDSDEFSADSDADQYEDVFEGWTIINMHLEDHFGKEGLSILQKGLSDLYQMEWCQTSSVHLPELRWTFNEDDKEALYLDGSNGRKRVIEWRFKDPEEYDD